MVSLTEKGFSRTLGFGQRPALLVVDFINGFTDPASPLGADVAREISETNRLLARFRQRRLPIYFSSIEYDDPSATDAGLWRKKITGLEELIAGSSACLVDQRLARRANEALIRKKFASCFSGTGFLSRLVVADVDTIVVAGCTTSGCVRATVVDACQSGIRPIVAQDAVADRLADTHRQSLTDITLKYGDVMPVDDIISSVDAIRDEEATRDRPDPA
ncbi:isochorismatase family protein [Bradyrhizobium sp. WD16]|uniref:isochorismatase family protein n=1 Tax=Bradyrhizobium sp. WD16 TaxID=1521768 RepID=UPI0020A2D7AC|nr:isochorismatase family protein [Bradyrhizobium sp. WD16]UTD29524.1 carbamoylsarcosine amidase [Bradyrhizobium sp. WD16]